MPRTASLPRRGYGVSRAGGHLGRPECVRTPASRPGCTTARAQPLTRSVSLRPSRWSTSDRFGSLAVASGILWGRRVGSRMSRGGDGSVGQALDAKVLRDLLLPEHLLEVEGEVVGILDKAASGKAVAGDAVVGELAVLGRGRCARGPGVGPSRQPLSSIRRRRQHALRHEPYHWSTETFWAKRWVSPALPAAQPALGAHPRGHCTARSASTGRDERSRPGMGRIESTAG